MRCWRSRPMNGRKRFSAASSPEVRQFSLRLFIWERVADVDTLVPRPLHFDLESRDHIAKVFLE
jgi:hypothetical protein